MEELLNNPKNREDSGRNPDGTWKKGFSGNLNGRPKTPLKDFCLKEFLSWTDQQKKDFVDKIDPFDSWRMTEGNPASDITSGGEKINPIPIIKVHTEENVHTDNSNGENTPDEKKD